MLCHRCTSKKLCKWKKKPDARNQKIPCMWNIHPQKAKITHMELGTGINYKWTKGSYWRDKMP